MERIKLTKTEKTVFRLIMDGNGSRPDEYPADKFSGAVKSLDRKGLVKAMYEEGGGVVDSMPTSEGRLYLSENPSLRNPVNWAVVSAIIGGIGAAAGILALFISCSGLL